MKLYIALLYVVLCTLRCLALSEVNGQKEMGKNDNTAIHGKEIVLSVDNKTEKVTSPELKETLDGNRLARNPRGDFNTPLHAAVSKRDLEEVNELLHRGECLNVKGKNGVTPLMLAAQEGYEEIVESLISKNANLEIKDEFGNAAIHHAIKKGNLHVVKTLLDNGANVNVKGYMGMTPLMLSSWKGDVSIANLLISRNASIELKNNNNEGAIHIALSRRKIRVCKALLDHGANVNSKGENDNTPLVLALISKPKPTESPSTNNNNPLLKGFHVTCKKCENNALLYLVKSIVERGADVNARNLIGRTALHEAAARGLDGIVDYLLSHNASFNFVDNVCYAPIHWAANNSKIEVIKRLLEYGDDVNKRGCNNVTALHLAIERNDSILMEFLLSKNVNPDVMREDGRTPLDLSFQRSLKPFIKLLLEHGAKVEDNSFLGSKVLFGAVANKSLELVNLLLDKTVNFDSYPTIILNYAIGTKFLEGAKLLILYGANFELTDIHGNVPLSSAVKSRSLDLVQLILDTAVRKIAKENIKTFLDADSKVKVFSKSVIEVHKLSPLHIAADHGLVDIAELLISHGASLGARDERKYTPLHYASENGHVQVVKLLLDHGANKGWTDTDGMTPVHLACRRGHFPTVKLLLSVAPMEIDRPDNEGYTPLHFAAINGSLEIVELLLDLDANVDATSKNLTTPLHLASIEGHEEIVRVLLKKGADSEASDVDDMTPLHFAARETHPNIVEMILKAKGFSASKNINGSSALHLTCGSYKTSPARKQLPFSEDLVKGTIKKILDRFVFRDDKDNNKMNVLHIASRDGSSTCIEVLLQSHNLFGDVWENTPLHYAALNGHIEIIRMILKKDSEERRQINVYHETPLILASREGHTDVVELLLQGGVDDFRPDINGRTPLHRSASCIHFEIVKLLLSSMARREAEDKWGFTPLNYAASWRKDIKTS